MYEALKRSIEAAWEDRSRLKEPATDAAIREAIRLVDRGELRTA